MTALSAATLACLESHEASPEIGEVAILAVLQGLTEFLPVSSSGHLTLGRAIFGVEGIEGALLTVALHVGTLVAVLAVYGRDLIGVLKRALGGKPRDLGLILLGSIPAATVGLAFGEFFERTFESPRVAAICLLVTAVWLVLGDRARGRQGAEANAAGTGLEGLGAGQALAIGAAQAVAIFPGISRSGSTIATGLLLGLETSLAARFSFLLSLPAVGGAALLELGSLGTIDRETGVAVLIGIVISAVVGVLALKGLLLALKRGAFGIFAAYCALLGLAWLIFGPFSLA